MKVFITASFKEGKNKPEIEQLCKIVKNSGFEDYCFIRDVENYQKMFNDPIELMNRARAEILNCDALLFDATEKSTGRAIEVGIAYANQKKIIVIMKDGTEIKDTLKGVADAVITYKVIKDIQYNLKQTYLDWTKS
jgi:2'-deoxynucleoside 5'-phosphate N-hydrolase